MRIKVLSLFSGIGAFEKALTNLNIDYELVGFSEIDKYAIEAYCAIHKIDEYLNLGDISGIKNEDLPECDLITYGFPCQDISVAGKQAGINEGTRSGLLYEAERVIEHCEPKYAIAENVKNLVGKRHISDFEQLLWRLNKYGYNNYWKVLNAKDYGIPQNRERAFVISIRKDVDNGKFKFPGGFDSGLRLKDMLEDVVNEKYYIDNEKVKDFLATLKDGKVGTQPPSSRNPLASYGLTSREHRASGWKETMGTLLARDYKDPKIIAEPKMIGKIADYNQRSEVWDPNGVAITQTANSGDIGGTTGAYLVPGTPNELRLYTNLSGGKWDKIHESSKRVYKEEGISPTIPTCTGGNIEPKVQTQMRIRKLTPLECFRLMGFTDDDYWKARKALETTFYNGRYRSNSQMYKMAGNSIVIQVLEEIFKNLLSTRKTTLQENLEWLDELLG